MPKKNHFNYLKFFDSRLDKKKKYLDSSQLIKKRFLVRLSVWFQYKESDEICWSTWINRPLAGFRFLGAALYMGNAICATIALRLASSLGSSPNKFANRAGRRCIYGLSAGELYRFTIRWSVACDVIEDFVCVWCLSLSRTDGGVCGLGFHLALRDFFATIHLVYVAIIVYIYYIEASRGVGHYKCECRTSRRADYLLCFCGRCEATRYLLERQRRGEK